LNPDFFLEEGPSSVPWQATALPMKILEKIMKSGVIGSLS